MGMATEPEWTFEDKPETTEPGWYAILYCWEIDEGFFTGAGYWDGKRWQWPHDNPSEPPVVNHAGPFENKQAAEGWAEENDPDRFDEKDPNG